MSKEDFDVLKEIEVPANPFPGLRPFEYRERFLFFGRSDQSGMMITKLSATRFLAVVGTSGSGKSSLVRAGLLPALYGGFMAGAGAAWRVAIMRPGNDPIGNLARTLNHTEVFGSNDPDNNALQEAITEATLRRGSLGLVEAVHQANMPASENLLVVVDQFEEIFRVEQGRRDAEYANDKAAFIKLLLGGKTQTETPIYVVLTMRSDYLGDCAQFWDLPEAINEGQYLIPRLTREQRRAAITGPVAVAGGEITPRLVNRLLNDVGDNPDQLPILQHALMRTWDEWTNKTPAHEAIHEGEAIDLCCYEAIGGMAQALSRHADEAYDEVGRQMGERGQQIVEKMFKALTEKGADNRETRRPLTLGTICDITEASATEVISVVEKFRAPGRSFLTPQVGVRLNADSLIDISHESLIRGWKGREGENGEKQRRLNEWVEEEARSARIYIRLADTAELHRDRHAALWRDPDLGFALDWQEKNHPNHHWAQRYHPAFKLAMKFLQASQREQEAERAEREAEIAARDRAQQQSLEQAKVLAAVQCKRLKEQAQSAARLHRFLAALVVAVLLASLAAGFAFWAYGRAEAESANANRQKKIAERNQANSLGRYSQSLSRKGNRLDAFVQALKAGKILQNLHATDPEVMSALQEAIDQESERNRLEGHKDIVNNVSFSPDGQILASGSADQTIRLWNVETGEHLRTLTGHSNVVYSVSFSSDGQTLASGGADQTIRLWNVKTDEQPRTLTGHSGYVLSVSFSPDGKTLASGSADQTIRLWNVKTDEQPRTLTGHSGYVLSVSFSPDGKILASSSKDKTIKPDGQILASGSADQTIKLWNVETGEEICWDVPSLGKKICDLTGHSSDVYRISFSPDGKTLASGSADQTIRLWNVETGEEICWDVPGPRKKICDLTGHSGYVLSVSFSPDSKILASSSKDKTIKLWNVETGKPRRTLTGHSGYVSSVSFSPDGKTLASSSADQSIKLWNVKPRRTLTGHSGYVSSISFSPDGKTLASARNAEFDERWNVELWNVETGEPRRTLTGHSGYVSSISFSPDGKTLASARNVEFDERWNVELWNVETGEQRHTLTGHKDTVSSVSFNPDGKTLASGMANQTIKLWNVETGEQRHTLTGHEDTVSSVSFSPDGKTLASGSADQTIKLWNVETGEHLRTLTGHSKGVYSVSFSPDGKTLASGSADQTIKLWNVETGREIYPLRGHDSKVNSVSFSPDGKTLASGSADQTIKLWNVETGREIYPLRGHTDTVNSVSFSRDGKTLASGSTDQTIKLWHPDLNQDSLLRHSCAWVRNYLTYNLKISKSDKHLCDGIDTKD